MDTVLHVLKLAGLFCLLWVALDVGLVAIWVALHKRGRR